MALRYIAGMGQKKAFHESIAIDTSVSVWALLQLDNDKEEEPWYVVSDMMLAELEVQRTINRTELCAFTMALPGFIGPSTTHTHH